MTGAVVKPFLIHFRFTHAKGSRLKVVKRINKIKIHLTGAVNAPWTSNALSVAQSGKYDPFRADLNRSGNIGENDIAPCI